MAEWVPGLRSASPGITTQNIVIPYKPQRAARYGIEFINLIPSFDGMTSLFIVIPYKARRAAIRDSFLRNRILGSMGPGLRRDDD
jgi:hypothetical protein